MKHLGRLFLLVGALAIGGGLGYLLLPGFNTVKMIAFLAICMVLGEVFYQIDNRISKE